MWRRAVLWSLPIFVGLALVVLITIIGCCKTTDGPLPGVMVAPGGMLVDYEIGPRGGSASLVSGHLEYELQDELDDGEGSVARLEGVRGAVGYMVVGEDSLASLLDWDGDGRPDYYHKFNPRGPSDTVLVERGALEEMRSYVLNGNDALCRLGRPASPEERTPVIKLQCRVNASAFNEGSRLGGTAVTAPVPSGPDEMPLESFGSPLLTSLGVLMPETPTGIISLAWRTLADVRVTPEQGPVEITQSNHLGMSDASLGFDQDSLYSLDDVENARVSAFSGFAPRLISTVLQISPPLSAEERCAILDSDYVRIAQGLRDRAYSDFDERVAMLRRLQAELNDKEEWLDDIAKILKQISVDFKDITIQIPGDARTPALPVSPSDIFEQISDQLKEAIREQVSTITAVIRAQDQIEAELRSLVRDVQLAISVSRLPLAAEFVNEEYRLWAAFMYSFSLRSPPGSLARLRSAIPQLDLFRICRYMEGDWPLSLHDSSVQGVFDQEIPVALNVHRGRCWSWETCSFIAAIGRLGATEFVNLPDCDSVPPDTPCGRLQYTQTVGNEFWLGEGNCVSGSLVARRYYEWAIHEIQISFIPVLSSPRGAIHDVAMRLTARGTFAKRTGARAPRGLQCPARGRLVGTYES